MIILAGQNEKPFCLALFYDLKIIYETFFNKIKIEYYQTISLMRKALVFISEIRALSALLFLIGLLDSNDTLELLTDADRSSVSNFSSSALLAIDFRVGSIYPFQYIYIETDEINGNLYI